MSEADPETDDVPAVVLDESPKAFRLRNPEGAEEWFPKSEIHFKSRNTKTGAAVVNVPLWLLKAKGWNG